MPALPEWARATDEPRPVGRIRSTPEDFRVSESLGFECSGLGEHQFLYVEKRAANTDWVARQLGRYAGVRARDVGYSGLKDRYAVTRQWFSVPHRNSPDWTDFELPGVTILDSRRHSRKLRRGSHQKNDFAIAVRGTGFQRCRETLAAHLSRIAAQGVPNYFGPQRFGRNASNLELADAWASGKRLARHQRSLAISTVRSFVFNELLHQRVLDATWNRIVDNDMACLDGSGSVFTVEVANSELGRRCAEMDIHPGGALVGADSPPCGPLEARPAWVEALRRDRVAAGYRPMRLRVQDLAYDLDDDCVTLRFALPRGGYATSVLAEVFEIQ